MNPEKKRIEELFETGDVHAIREAVDQYKKAYPHDVEILTFQANCRLLEGDTDAAYQYAAEGVRRLPLNGDMQYNYAVLCECKRRWLDAYEAYYRAYYLYCYCKDEKAKTLAPLQSADAVLEAYEKEYLHSADRETRMIAANELRALWEAQKNNFSLDESAFRSDTYPQIVGNLYYENRFTCRYAGVFKDQFLSRMKELRDMDVMHIKAELLPVSANEQIKMEDACEAYILP